VLAAGITPPESLTKMRLITDTMLERIKRSAPNTRTPEDGKKKKTIKVVKVKDILELFNNHQNYIPVLKKDLQAVADLKNVQAVDRKMDVEYLEVAGKIIRGVCLIKKVTPLYINNRIKIKSLSKECIRNKFPGMNLKI
jgi:hypothetical protein